MTEKIIGVPNMLSQLGFSLDIKKAPYMSAMAYEVNTPDIQSGYATAVTPFKDLPFGSDKLQYGDLTVSFKVDENLKNYMEIFNWIKGITFPVGYTQHAAASNAPNRDGIYSDATMLLLSNSSNPLLRYHLKDLFPISLTGLSVISQDDDVDYISATVVFKVTDFSIESITNS